MNARAEELRRRTKKFAVHIVKFCETLPNTIAGRKIGGQLIDSGTSVAANFWLELIGETELAAAKTVEPLRQEADELTAIFTASLRTAKGERKAKPSNR